jgi:hypothetical protein
VVIIRIIERNLRLLLIALAVAVVIILIPKVLAYGEGEQVVTPVQEITVEEVIEVVEPIVVVPGIPWQLKEIARCESGGTHYKADGEVVRGRVNPLDIGKYQINLKYHQATAEKMGLDLFDEADNEAYALHLYKTQGAQPWSASNPCHHLLD